MKASEIIAAARECIDTPFAHQGRLINKALDCAGVAVHVFDSMGCEVKQPAAYSRTPNNAMLEYWADRQPFLTRETIPQAGDILLMKFKTEPQHVAIFTGTGLIHAYEKFGKVVEHDIDAKWRKRIVRAYRFKGIEA
jgi:cell wall-associated NlpC family hydrolase